MTLHTRKVFGLAYRFTGRVDEAEDLTQEVFVKVYQTLDRYREADGPFAGWLMAVARNHAIDHYRRRKQERLRRTEDPELLETTPSRDEHPIAGLEREERARLVHRGLRALPPDLRLPLILCDLQGLPYDEIAATLQVPLGTVKSRINRARLELAKRLMGRRRELDGGALEDDEHGLPRAEELLSDHLEGSLHAILRSELDAHLAAARSAARCARRWREVVEALRGVPRARAAPGPRGAVRRRRDARARAAARSSSAPPSSSPPGCRRRRRGSP